MRLFTVIVLAIMLNLPFTGCLDPEDNRVVVEDTSVFNFDRDIPITTWYHYGGTLFSPYPIDATNQTALDGANLTVDLVGNNAPFFVNSTYYGTGFDTFEPTIGVTSSGAIFFTNFNGAGDGTHIIRSLDLGQTWEDVGPFLNGDEGGSGQTLNSNDPYIYVDKFTDRLVKFDMHALAVINVEYSDNDGDSWSTPFPTHGYAVPQDHQSIASMPHPNALSGDVVYVYCINTGSAAAGPQCSRSLDGGITWDAQRPGYPIGTSQCSGLHAHLVGSHDGTIYRGNPSCDGPAVYRSTDGGSTWTEHTITTELGMHPVLQHAHEVATAVDDEGNLYAVWIADDFMPWYSYSRDQGNTWNEPMMIAAPGVTETGFPTIFAGSEGRVVIGYIGEVNDVSTNATNSGWSGYMAVMTDAFAENPLITSVAVNDPSDPLDITSDCGARRCGGFGDFIDVELDDQGRPWVALAHNTAGFDEAIIGTLTEGPSLYGDLTLLEILPPGGPSTLKLG